MAFYQKNFALITGASSGIGKAIAEELARKKINLILIALPGTRLEDTAVKIASEHSISVLHIAIDLTEEGAAQKIYQWCMVQGVAIRILINNAGIGNIDYLENSRTEILNTMLLLNNHALIMLTHSFLGHMKKHKAGFIMNVGSLASFLPIPKKSVYTATKGFVYAFSCALRNELIDTGISVSCLCPGSTQTSESVRQNLQSTSYKGNLFTQTAQQVAQEGIQKMFEGKRRIIPGWQNKLLFLLWTILPYGVASAILIKIFNNGNGAVKGAKLSERKPVVSMALVYR